MTIIHYLLLIFVSVILSSITLYYLKSRKISISLFYFCSIYLLFIVSLPFAAGFYSYIFNEILDLPDARISIVASVTFSISIVNIYLLSKQARQEKQLRILNRELALISHRLKKHHKIDI